MEDRYNAIVSRITMENNHEGVLSGWDVAIKDNFNLKGTYTTASSKLLQNYQSLYTASSVDKLILQGANLVCKTSMDELGMGGTGRNAYTGPTKNPHDLERISGGSSSGSAALVAGKLVRMALGSDTGDSVRKPASYCGVVGMKPSYGRISRYGLIAYASSLDHVGYFTHNVKDSAETLNVLAGRDDLDLQSSFEPVPNYTQYDASLEGKRIGIFSSVHSVMDQSIVGDAIEDLKKTLSAKGAIIVEKTMPLEILRTVLPVYNVISNVEALANHASLDGVRFGEQGEGATLEEIMTQTRTQGIGSKARIRYTFGAFASEGENHEAIFEKTKKVRRVITNAYSALFDDIDALCVMASGTIAARIDDVEVYSNEDSHTIGENHLALQNMSGHPSITIPWALYEGMPLGLNITGKLFQEQTLFGIAAGLEKGEVR